MPLLSLFQTANSVQNITIVQKPLQIDICVLVLLAIIVQRAVGLQLNVVPVIIANLRIA